MDPTSYVLLLPLGIRRGVAAVSNFITSAGELAVTIQVKACKWETYL